MPSLLLDRLVSASELSHGATGRTLDRVADNEPIVIMRNNRPAAVMISPGDYRRLTEAEEDFVLYQEAMERMGRDDGTRYTMEDVFGDAPVDDDGYEPEFE